MRNRNDNKTTRELLTVGEAEGKFRASEGAHIGEIVVDGRTFRGIPVAELIDFAHDKAADRSAGTITVYDGSGATVRHWVAGHRYF